MAIGGFFVGTVLASILVEVVVVATHAQVVNGQPVHMAPGLTVADEVGLWIGLVGAALLASRVFGTRHVASDLRLQLRPWPDVPVGVAVGLGSQFLLVPLLYLPFEASDPNLTKTLSHEAVTLTSSAHGVGFAIVALVVVVGAPIVEELFFRGLLLRALEAWFGAMGARVAPVLAILVMGVAFGFSHAEGLLLAYGLGVFGMVLGILARGFKRLGPGIVAHAAFNLTSVIAIAVIR